MSCIVYSPFLKVRYSVATGHHVRGDVNGTLCYYYTKNVRVQIDFISPLPNDCRRVAQCVRATIYIIPYRMSRTIISGTGITFDTGESTDITLQLTCPAPGVLAFTSRVDSEGQALPNVLSGVGYPTQSDHAANRNYVDLQVATVSTLVDNLDTQVQAIDTSVHTQVQGIDTQVQGIDTQVQTLNGAVTSMGNGTAIINVNEVDCVTLDVTSDVAVGGHLTATSVTSTSDRRLKDHILPLSRARATDILRSLQPVTYNWASTGVADIGFVAQEVQAIVPEFVYTSPDGTMSMDYGKITALLVAAWQHAHDTL
jgi:hypothetical protein